MDALHLYFNRLCTNRIVIASNPIPELASLQQEHRKKKKDYLGCHQEINNLNREKHDLKIEAASLHKRLSAFCIQKRNVLVTKRMKSAFSASLSELEQEIKNEGDTASSVSTRVCHSDPSNEVQVFCVCSIAYQQFLGRLDQDPKAVGFYRVEDTFVPQLIKYMKESTLKAQEKLSDDNLEEMKRLLTRMAGWMDNTVPDKQISMREKRLLNCQFTKEHDKLIEVCYF
jgi:hypothetical protein